MLPDSMVAVMLIIFGIGMNVGNVVGSWFADMSLMGTIGGGPLVFNIVVLTLFSLTAASPFMLALCVILYIGCGFAAGPASLRPVSWMSPPMRRHLLPRRTIPPSISRMRLMPGSVAWSLHRVMTSLPPATVGADPVASFGRLCVCRVS